MTQNNISQNENIRNTLSRLLLASRGPDAFFESHLSDSAISTAVAIAALAIADESKYQEEIQLAQNWLVAYQNPQGLYGDSPESPPNLTATFMSYVVLQRDKKFQPILENARRYLVDRFGDFSFDNVQRAFMQEYGRDLTFSVPIMALATATGFFQNTAEAWQKMPRFPFEVVSLPERVFHWLNLPVVSYAIPALICIGLAQLSQSKNRLVKSIRSLFQRKALRVLLEKQPESGGFLEAAPLTAFCALCLCVAGLREHSATKNALRFLLETQRKNGSWPIDVDLRQWTTSLAITVLGDSLSDEEKKRYCLQFKANQTKKIHPFTRSAPGGWGWTTRSGSVPDADDTSAAIVALHHLGEPANDTVCKGIEWLLNLQNRDGGIPTFCRGWSALPFDRSCPDISAHAYKAFSLYEKELPTFLRSRVASAKHRIIEYLKKVQQNDGSFIPLWFGDQESADGSAPVYGSAVVLEHLNNMNLPFLKKTKEYLLQKQHKTGGWGTPCPQGRDYVIFTARCVSALRNWSDTKETKDALDRALSFLRPFALDPENISPEPIGLYFAHLWYDELLYSPVFLATAFSKTTISDTDSANINNADININNNDINNTIIDDNATNNSAAKGELL